MISTKLLFMFRDLIQIIYNYCDIYTLQNLSLSCKKYHSYADEKYYEKRIELFFKLTVSDLLTITATTKNFYEKRDDNNRKNETKAINYYIMHQHYHNIKNLFTISRLLHQIEKKSKFIYTICMDMIEYNDKNSKKTETRTKKEVKKLVDSIRYNHFRTVMEKNNIQHLPKVHISGGKSKCKANISSKEYLHLFDCIRDHEGNFYCMLMDGQGLKAELCSDYGKLPAKYHECLRMFEIKDFYDMSLLYRDKMCHVDVAGYSFVNAVIVNGFYKANFKVGLVPQEEFINRHLTYADLEEHEKMY